MDVILMNVKRIGLLSVEFTINDDKAIQREIQHALSSGEPNPQDEDRHHLQDQDRR
jgi:hypothetical protein